VIFVPPKNRLVSLPAMSIKWLSENVVYSPDVHQMIGKTAILGVPLNFQINPPDPPCKFAKNFGQVI
jgi:hypothetical protein